MSHTVSFGDKWGKFSFHSNERGLRLRFDRQECMGEPQKNVGVDMNVPDALIPHLEIWLASRKKQEDA